MQESNTSKYKYRKQTEQNENEKSYVLPLTYAGTSPRAVMVKTRHAAVTVLRGITKYRKRAKAND